MVVIGTDEALSIVGASGRRTVLEPSSDAQFRFPTWSPDGSKIAVLRYTANASQILVFDAAAATSNGSAAPVVILDSTTIGAFYLSWTPDGKTVSYLANEGTGQSLRRAPADGSAPVDGSGPGSTIRSGFPFYFDWIGTDRLLAHIGDGTSAFLGEIGLDGSARTALDSPGDFRPPVASRDGRFIGYVRTAGAGGSFVVVSGRDGSNERTIPVFGPAAVTFDPVGDTLATIGAIAAPATPLAIPVGPVRLIDAASGKARTILDGSVVAFWWSPDGRTIAALRVQPVAVPAPSGGSSPGAGASPVASEVASAGPDASTAPQSEVRLVFVDTASGLIRSQPLVSPGQLFIEQLLPFFDQYALSHRLWAPDGSSLLMPIMLPDGLTQLYAIPADGGPVRTLDGIAGFWSP